jgi:hypothetical protein
MSRQRIGKYAWLEIERRYLLRRLPTDVERSTRRRITDHYLISTRLRLRLIECGAEVTRKLAPTLS